MVKRSWFVMDMFSGIGISKNKVSWGALDSLFNEVDPNTLVYEQPALHCLSRSKELKTGQCVCIHTHRNRILFVPRQQISTVQYCTSSPPCYRLDTDV